MDLENEKSKIALHVELSLFGRVNLGQRGFGRPYAAIAARLPLLRSAEITPGIEATNRVRPLAIMKDYLVG
jgi:hypothetical protein